MGCESTVEMSGLQRGGLVVGVLLLLCQCSGGQASCQVDNTTEGNVAVRNNYSIISKRLLENQHKVACKYYSFAYILSWYFSVFR